MKLVENYNAIKQLITTGDLILFHGPGPESELIGKIEPPPFSHVAMVVKLPKYEKPLLWTSDEIAAITDVLGDKRQKGVHLLDLASVLKFCVHQPSKSGGQYSYTWRKLNYHKPPNFMNLLEQFMQHVDGTAFPSLAAMAVHFFAGSVGISTGAKSMCCSELITDTYVHLNLLPADTVIHSYSTGSYAEGQHLPLLDGATLDPEVAFNFND